MNGLGFNGCVKTIIDLKMLKIWMNGIYLRKITITCKIVLHNSIVKGTYHRF